MNENCVLGKGGFGTIYLGTFKSQSAAVKVLSVECDDSSEMLEEVVALMQMKSPRLVALFGIYMETEREKPQSPCKMFKIYIVMERLKVDLRNYLKQQIVLSYLEKKSILLDILRGLLDLEHCGYAHCDLKMQNVMFDFNNNVKLVDFGLSKFIPGGTRKSSIMGCSERYSAREYL